MTTSATIDATTMPHTGDKTCPNSTWGPVNGSGGSLEVSQKNPAMTMLIAAARKMRVRAAALPPILCTRSRNVKVKG